MTPTLSTPSLSSADSQERRFAVVHPHTVPHKSSRPNNSADVLGVVRVNRAQRRVQHARPLALHFPGCAIRISAESSGCSHLRCCTFARVPLWCAFVLASSSHPFPSAGEMSLSTAPTPVPSEKHASVSISSAASPSSTDAKSASPSPASTGKAPSSSTAARPSAVSVAAAEYRNAHKWDACVENALVKTGYGLLAAGAASLLLFSQ